jgi:hypothetical protein
MPILRQVILQNSRKPAWLNLILIIFSAQSFANSTEVERDLKEFSKANEKRSYQYFESLIKLDSSVHDIYKAKVRASNQLT